MNCLRFLVSPARSRVNRSLPHNRQTPAFPTTGDERLLLLQRMNQQVSASRFRVPALAKLACTGSGRYSRRSRCQLSIPSHGSCPYLRSLILTRIWLASTPSSHSKYRVIVMQNMSPLRFTKRVRNGKFMQDGVEKPPRNPPLLLLTCQKPAPCTSLQLSP